MEVHLGNKAETYENGESLSDVMTWNHYGTETIPPRPVLTIAAENTLSSAEMKKRIKAYLSNVATYTLAGRKSDLIDIESKLLTTIGQQSIAEAKRIIQGGSELQENAPKTIAKKGFDKPLYEIGLMIKNLSFEVTE